MELTQEELDDIIKRSKLIGAIDAELNMINRQKVILNKLNKIFSKKIREIRKRL